MFIITVLFIFFISCGTPGTIFKNDSQTNDEDKTSCGGYEVLPIDPVMPKLPEIEEISKFEGDFSDCVPLSKINQGELVLTAGCYKGCITVSGDITIKGEGSGVTAIICEDIDAKAVINVEKNSNAVIEKVTLTGNTRGIFADKKSTVFIRETAIEKCTKGGINVCGGESECGSRIEIESCFIGNIISEKESGISYGISMGPGEISIRNSNFSEFNSFGIALWGEKTSERVVAKIENVVISNIYGGNRDYDGHAIYAEDGVDLKILRSVIQNSATSFIYFSSESSGADLLINDLTLKDLFDLKKEQGGIVLEGNLNVDMKRVYLNNSRGNGIFSNGVNLTAEDVLIDSVFSDGLQNNGFGLMLFDGSTTVIDRIKIKNSQIAGILMDGKANAVVKNFQIIKTRPNPNTLEFGVGAAIQDEAEVIMENGIFSENKECGIMAVNGKIELHNVEIKNTYPRECAKNNKCPFAPGVPFGHGVSLYHGSVLSFSEIYILRNSNGLNIESSKVIGKDNKRAKFIGNVTAVNAWNISSFDDLENNLENSEYCENQTVFTTDIQPVRDGI